MISVYLRLSKLRKNLKRVTEFIITRHHPVRTPMTMPLQHTSRGMSHLGMHEGKLYLGQKPKLGGGIPTSFTHICIIFGRFFVYPCFTFFCCFSSLFSFLFVLFWRLLLL